MEKHLYEIIYKNGSVISIEALNVKEAFVLAKNIAKEECNYSEVYNVKLLEKALKEKEGK